MENYPEHFGQDLTIPELLTACKIDTLKVAVDLSKSPKQKAAEVLKNRKREQEKEEKRKQTAVELEKFLEAKQKKRKIATEKEAAAAAEEEEVAEKEAAAAAAENEAAAAENEAADDDIEQELKEVEESLSRRDSTSSVEKQMNDLAIYSAYDESLKNTAVNKIELLKRQVRILREKVVRLTKTTEDEEIVAEVDANFRGDPTGDSQWDF